MKILDLKIALAMIGEKLAWLKPADKQGHAWAGLALALLFKPLVCLAIGFVPGLVQAAVTMSIVTVIAAIKEEIYDRKTGGDVDPKDAYATCFGGLVGIVLGYMVIPFIKLVL